MTKTDNKLWKVLLATGLAHVIWGFSFMASRKALDLTSMPVLLSHRFLLAFLLMHLWPRKLRELRGLKAGQRGQLLLLGLLEPVLYFFGEQYGLLHSTSIFSGVMIALIPVIATLIAAPVLKERPTPGQLLFSALSVLGVIGVGLLSGEGGRPELLGVLALLLAVVSAVGYSLLSRSLSAQISSFTRTYVMMGVGAVVFTALALWQCREDLGAYIRPLQSPAYLLPLGYLGVLCSVLSYVLSGYSISYLTVARETVFANLTTVVSVFAGAVFLHEPFSWIAAICCIGILVGIWGVQRSSQN